MRYTLIIAGVFVALATAGCGSAEATVQPAPSTPPVPVASVVQDATAAPAVPKETLMPAKPVTPAPPTESHPVAPTAPPTESHPVAPTARPTFRATPLAPRPTVAPAPPAASAPAIAPALSAIVDGARADLARRQSVDIDRVAVVEARSVTWPDPSLGCPQPGMAYRQVPVDGIFIRLRVDGASFSYHGGGGRPPFLCEQKGQSPPSAPPPGMSQ